MIATATYLTVEEAQGLVLDHARPGPIIEVALSQALGRTLAVPVTTDMDYPPFDRSIMDGFAVRSADVSTVPVTLRIVGEIAAGSAATRGVKAGEAVRINTGAPMPVGADAVVRVEDTSVAEGQVRINAAALPRQSVAYRAEYARRGDVVVEAGCRIGAGQISAAGSAGADQVSVYQPPRVVVLSTGNELVGIDQVPTGPQIRNSNSAMLCALALQAGASVSDLGNVRDDRTEIAAKIRAGLDADVVCVTGGVSMGQLDLVPEALESCGVRLIVRKLQAKPAKPTLFGVSPHGSLVFGLPGNPISAFVGFWLLVRPALAALQGRSHEVPRVLQGRLRGRLKPNGDRQSYLPARAEVEDGELAVSPLGWGGSGDPFGVARSNALLVRDIDSPAVADGDTVGVLLLDAL